MMSASEELSSPDDRVADTSADGGGLVDEVDEVDDVEEGSGLLDLELYPLEFSPLSSALWDSDTIAFF